MSACPAFEPTRPYAAQVLALSDCHAQALAQGGWQALAGAGAGGALTGLLTLFVALIGYRLMLGRGLDAAEGAGLLARLALVLALATQAPAYRALVEDVAMAGPHALATALAGAAGLGPVAAPAQAAQADALAAQASLILSTPSLAPDPAPMRAGWRRTMPATPGLPEAVTTPLHWASGVLMVTVLVGWLATRLVTGVLLGLGPVLVAGLLFAGTRGLALGWMRVLAGAALGQVVVALVIAMELSLAQGQMAGLVAALDAGAAPVAMADGLLTTVLVFAAIMLAGMMGMARVGAGLAWPQAWRKGAGSPRSHGPMPAATPAMGPRTALVADRRVERVAAAALAMDRRAMITAAMPVGERLSPVAAGPGASAREGGGAQVIRLGQSTRRQAPRLSRQAMQRDGHA